MGIEARASYVSASDRRDTAGDRVRCWSWTGQEGRDGCATPSSRCRWTGSSAGAGDDDEGAGGARAAYC